MAQGRDYAIRGGAGGRERLRILSRIMYASTTSLFDRLGINDGLLCFDIGCGGGDVTLEFARRIGPRGKAIGADMDETKLDIARREAEALGIRNVEFRYLDIRSPGNDISSDFDVVYARFLLTHLDDPSRAVSAFYRYLRPGGLVIAEDIDFNGAFHLSRIQSICDTGNSIAKWSGNGAAIRISGHACRSCLPTAA